MSMNYFGKTWSEEEVKSILQIHTSKLGLTFFLSWAMTDGLSAVIFNEDTFQVSRVRLRFKTPDCPLWTCVAHPEIPSHANPQTPVDELGAPPTGFPLPCWDLKLDHVYITLEGAERRCAKMQTKQNRRVSTASTGTACSADLNTESAEDEEL